MGLLDGQLQAIFGAAFAGIILTGSLHRITRVQDGDGDVTSTLGGAEPIKGFREQTSERERRELGYADGEARLLIMQTYGGRVIPRPDRGSVIELEGVRWVIGDGDADPANASWTFRASRE